MSDRFEPEDAGCPGGVANDRPTFHERERRTPPPALPASIAPLAESRSWFRDAVGESGSDVFRVRGSDGDTDLYLKHGRAGCAQDVTDEFVRLRWLAGRIPVPAVLHFEAFAGDAWLLTEAMHGQTAFQALAGDPEGRPRVAAALGLFLRGFHALPVEQCPFNSDHRLRLAQAEVRRDEGSIDTGDFGDDHRGWTTDQLWDEMSGLLPLAPDPVVTHGDFSLDNLFYDDGVVLGCIDVGRMGIADRYQDIAILTDCLGEFDVALRTRFLASYGLKALDEGKLRFHLALDECF